MEQAPEVDLTRILNLRDFEDLARQRLERSAYDYIAGGAGDETTLAENTRAFARYQLRPRVLRDVSRVDTSTFFLGRPVSLPVGVAPMAYQHFAHAEGEAATGRAAARAGALICLSTMSSRSLEEVAAAADEAGGGPRWFQLYVHRDRALAADLVARAEAAGFGAVALTVDLPIAGVRERDTRNRFDYPQQFGNFVRPEQVSAVVGGFNDASLSWADLPWLRGLSQLPLVVKGILTAEDAVLAVGNGAAGIVVSNHGGRQLDRVPASIDVLREVVEAVDGRAEVYLDGGVRRAVDVLTALALGARGVLIGRPFGHALAVGGEAGVARALELIGDELRTDMALLGVTAVDQISAAHVRRASPAGG